MHADSHYDIRVNIVENAETGKYEFDDSDFLQGLITKVSAKSLLKICLRLQDLKYQEIDTKLGYQPKKLCSQKWLWSVNRHVECLIWDSPINARSHDLTSETVVTGANCSWVTKTKVHMNKKENQELSMLIGKIETSVQGREEGEKSKKGRGRTLKEVWKIDGLEFLNDQRRNGNYIYLLAHYNKMSRTRNLRQSVADVHTKSG